MKIQLAHGLAYVEVILTFRGRGLRLGNTILDTDGILGLDYLLRTGARIDLRRLELHQ